MSVTQRPAPTGNARHRVMGRLIGRAKRFPRLGPEPLDTSGLDARDAALANAIDHAVARHWSALATIAHACLRRPWSSLEAVVQAPLLAGAAQLLLLERVPDHAAINESVQWTKIRSPGAAGLVNAVLRKIAELRDEVVDAHDVERRDELPRHDGRAWRLKRNVFDEDPLVRLAQTTSHAPDLLARWRTRLGWAATVELAQHSLVHPPIILAIGATAAAELDDPRLSPHETPGFAVYGGPRAELSEVLAAYPGARVQDPGTAAAVEATRAVRARRIVDLCAGRGTKTRQLAEVHPDATIIASDPDDERRAALRATFADDGAGGRDAVEVVDVDQLIEHAGRADLVLVDAPCSNTAALARRVEAKLRFDEAGLASLIDVQRQILADAMRLVAPGGTVVYSTCSLEPEENEEQARWLAKWHDLEIAAMWSRPPSGQPGEPGTSYRDGAFFARLRRNSG